MTAPYILPASTVSIPGKLTLAQFLQTVFVGLTGISGALVRPKWQIAPPNSPDLQVDWLAFGIDTADPDANAYLGLNSSGAVISQRHEKLEIGLSIYGPASLETYELIRDGFQIPQNLGSLQSANMNFVEVGRAMHVPELVNERFINRITASVILRREIQRTYPIATFTSVTGILYASPGTDLIQSNFAVDAQTGFIETEAGITITTQNGTPILRGIQ